MCTFSLFKGTNETKEIPTTVFRGDSSFRRRWLWWPPILVRKNGWIQPDPSLASGSPQGNARHLYENWNLNFLWENHQFFLVNKNNHEDDWISHGYLGFIRWNIPAAGRNIHLSDGHLTVILGRWVWKSCKPPNHGVRMKHHESLVFSGTIHKAKMVKSWNVQMVFLFHHGAFHVDLFLRVYRSECDNRSLAMTFFSPGFCASTSLHKELRLWQFADFLWRFFDSDLIFFKLNISW